MIHKTTVELKTFTPADAQRILAEYNKRNRNIKPATVALIARDLTDGRYLVNGETIKFATDGMLLDGQNRLAACVRANVPLTSWVVRGIDNDAFDTIDVGLPRTGGDILHVQNESHAPVLAAALTLVGAYEAGRLPKGSISRNRLRPLLEAHPTIRESVTRIANNEISKQKLASKPILAFMHYMLSKVDPVKATEFFDRLEDGASLAPGSPILVLRNRLIRNAADPKKLASTDVFALCLKAWDAFFNERSINKLSFSRNREQFPGIAGLDDLLGNVQAAA